MSSLFSKLRLRPRDRSPKDQSAEDNPGSSGSSTLSVRSIRRRLSRNRSPCSPPAGGPHDETAPTAIQTDASLTQLSAAVSAVAIAIPDTSTSPPDIQIPVDIVSAKQEANRPEHLWDEAYDELKNSHPKLMQLYETILSDKLHDYNFDPSKDECRGNQIEQSASDGRRDQMRRLIQAGQDKNERENKIKGGIKDAMGIVMAMRTIINSTIQAVPQAALPWAIVCMSLEILQNPLNESASNASGIRYVTRRMERYWDIATDLFEKDEPSNTQMFMKSQLVELYKELLLFQIKSVCSYYRHRGLTLLRDIVKLDDWAGHLENIQKIETEFQRDYGDYQSQQQTKASLEIVRILERLVSFQIEQKEAFLGEQDRQCLRELRITNPRDDRKRIIDAKGGLLWEAYCWVLRDSQFQRWHEKQSQLLWVRGDPGKGKTMLLCGILQELEDSTPFLFYLSYFFCQGTDQSLNNANAVLRGLIYMFICQQPSLISHLQKEYKDAGTERLFDDVNAWITLSRIFENILQDLASTTCYVVIDALDECILGRKRLLELIVRNMSNFPNIRWIVSSRNFDDIERQLSSSADITLSLEVNADTVSEAVASYINDKIPRLDLLSNNQALQENMRREMIKKANGTFLWAALVFKRLQELDDFIPEDDLQVLAILRDIPSGLTELYHRMIDQIDQSLEDSLNNRVHCFAILSTMALAYQPIRLVELPALTGFKNNTARLENMARLVRKCGSFLTIRGGTIYFIHQSARDYLVGQGRAYLFNSGYGAVHREIFSHSIDAMLASKEFQQNMYSLSHPGVEIKDITAPDPDPIEGIRYSCVYWLRHLRESITCQELETHISQANNVYVVEKAHKFFKSHLLIWLEALSLMKQVQKGIDFLQRLVTLIKEHSKEHQGFSFFEDARRFILYHALLIEEAPLQTYISALIFSPMKCLVRLNFIEELSWIKTLPVIDEHWSPCIQTIRDRNEDRISVELSSDNKFLATSYKDGTVKVWDLSTGENVYVLQIEEETAVSITCSRESILLALISDNTPLRLWDATLDKEVRSFPCDFGHDAKLKFSNDSSFLAMIHTERSKGTSFTILDVVNGKEMQHDWRTPKGYEARPVLSHDLKLLAQWYGSKTMKILDTITGEEKQVFEDCDEHWSKMAFSEKSTLLAFRSDSGTITIWETITNELAQTIRYPTDRIYAMAFEGDSRLIVCLDSTVNIWDVKTGALCRSASLPNLLTFKMFFSRNSTLIVSPGIKDIGIWDVPMMIENKSVENPKVASLAISNDAKLMAASFSSSYTRTTIWHIDNEKEVHTVVHQDDSRLGFARCQEMAFSSDSRLLATVRRDDLGAPTCISLWSIETGKEINTWFQEKSGCSDSNVSFASLTFSCDSSLLAIARTECNTIQVWDTSTFQKKHVLQRQETLNFGPQQMALSTDSKFLAMTGVETPLVVDIWNLESQTLIKKVRRNSELHDIVFDNSTLCMATDMGYVGLDIMNGAMEDAEPQVLIQLQPATTEILKERYTMQFPRGLVIYWNLKKLIFFPLEYRICSKFHPFTSSSSMIKIATEIRGILTFQFPRPRQGESEGWTPWQSSKLFGGQLTNFGSC